jgi:hypothetical protein
VLCVPEFSILPRDLYEARPDGSPVTFRAWAYPLTAEAKDVLARCDHGTFQDRLRGAAGRCGTGSTSGRDAAHIWYVDRPSGVAR